MEITIPPQSKVLPYYVVNDCDLEILLDRNCSFSIDTDSVYYFNGIPVIKMTYLWGQRGVSESTKENLKTILEKLL